ncbi:MAG: sigma-70 family RNA polymerase sigma factor [Phycisphaerales bacterium]|nr:MAG: sigma-70 family RNA polymerase sigma factor [Phycisphaerales bacterium]
MFDAGEGMLSSDNRTEIHQRVRLAAEVFDKYSDDIRAIIHFHVRNKSKVDDVFQDFFVSLVRNPIPSHVEDIKAYLYRAVTNDVIDIRRQMRNRRDCIQKYAEAQKSDMIQEDPQNGFIQAEATKKMFRLIEGHLPKREATVVAQRYGSGLSTTDMAKKMHLDKRSICQYLSKARRRMRRFMSESVGDAK